MRNKNMMFDETFPRESADSRRGSGAGTPIVGVFQLANWFRISRSLFENHTGGSRNMVFSRARQGVPDLPLQHPPRRPKAIPRRNMVFSRPGKVSPISRYSIRRGGQRQFHACNPVYKGPCQVVIRAGAGHVGVGEFVV